MHHISCLVTVAGFVQGDIESYWQNPGNLKRLIWKEIYFEGQINSFGWCEIHVDMLMEWFEEK